MILILKWKVDFFFCFPPPTPLLIARKLIEAQKFVLFSIALKKRNKKKMKET